MIEENKGQEFRLKSIEEIKNCYMKKTDQNELMSNKQKKGLTTLNYISTLLF